MNCVDIALLLVIFLALISGVSSGFIAGSIHLLNWLGSLFLALIFYPYTATALTKIFPGLGVWKLPLAFISTVINYWIFYTPTAKCHSLQRQRKQEQ